MLLKQFSHTDNDFLKATILQAEHTHPESHLDSLVLRFNCIRQEIFAEVKQWPGAKEFLAKIQREHPNLQFN